MNLQVAFLRLGGILKAEEFGDGKYLRNHPQAALVAATHFPTIHKLY